MKLGGVPMIKKIPISFVMLFLLGGTLEKANAVERIVISSLPSELWYDNLFLMADTIDGNWMAHRNFTIQVGLGGGESVLLYHFPNWYNDKFTPELFYDDLTGDHLKDIGVVLISGAGSGISTKEIHLLNQIQNPNRRYEEVPVESINDAVKRLVKMERQGNLATILIGKKKHVVELSKFHYLPGTFSPSPGVGQEENYSAENGVLYGTTVVYISPAGHIGTLRIKYYWDGKMYKAKSIEFEEAEPYKLE
jgi:hypothetical protein